MNKPDFFVASDRYWIDNSNQQGIYAIKYLVQTYGCSEEEAKEYLAWLRKKAGR